MNDLSSFGLWSAPLQVENDEYQIKPMNCPFHCLVYKSSPRSYRDLPIRWAELGTVYRYERSVSLSVCQSVGWVVGARWIR